MKNAIGIAFGSVLVLGGCFLGAVLYATSRPVPSVEYTFSYVTSSEETTEYCDGERMDSAGYRASLTVQHTGIIPKASPTMEEIIRATLNAATTGMCHTVMSETSFAEKDGVVTISPIDAWAGIAISMCSCIPQVEVNLLQIPGIHTVRWAEDVDTHSDIIFVTSPLPYATVTSPLLVTGEARGDWFFETDFPVRLLNAQGEIIGQGTAEAQGNWMTSYFVPFEATITFTSDAQTKNTAGTLVLEKNNIYGRPENADELRVPVTIGE